MCGVPGSLYIGISGGNAPYSVSWDGPQSGSSTTSSNFNINSLLPGTYIVTVVGANGCTKTGEVEIFNNGEAPDVAISTSASICNGGGDITVIYGSGSATISWAGPVSGSANAMNGTFVIPSLPSGAYSVTILNDMGCDVTVNANIIDVENQFNFSVTPQNGLCQTNGSAMVNYDPGQFEICLLYTSPSPRDATLSRMPSSA